MKRRFLSPEELETIRRLYADMPTKALARQIGLLEAQVYRAAKNLGVRKSESYLASPDACRLRRGDEIGKHHRFPKGHVPANKGKRSPGVSHGRMATSQFKKGQPSGNTMPLGARRTIGGYLYRKTSEVPKVPYTVNWKPEHHLIWEEHTGTKVCFRTHALVFKDGDRSHVEFSNLELITRKELRRRNSIHELPEQIQEVLHLKALINSLITRRRKKESIGNYIH
jgi:hypothetical protein